MDLKLSTDPKSEDGKLLYFLSTMIAAYTNSHVHFDLKETPEPERKTEIERLKSWMEELLH